MHSAAAFTGICKSQWVDDAIAKYLSVLSSMSLRGKTIGAM